MKFRSKILLLIFLFIISSCVTVFADDYENPYDKIKELEEKNKDLESLLKPTPEQPRIALSSPKSYLSMKAGDKVTVDIEVKNVSQYLANDVLTEIKADPSSPIVAGLLSESGITKLLQPNVAKKFSVDISVDSSAKTGTYSVTFVHKYTNNVGDDLSSESSLQIKVKNDEEVPNVVLTEIKSSSAKVNPGDSFNISAKVSNLSKQVAKNLKISISGLSSDTIFLNNSTSLIDMVTFGPNATDNISIQLASNKKVKEGSYEVILKLSYTDDKATAYSNDYSYYVNVGKSSGDTDNKSELVITNITSPTDKKDVNENFDMTITLKNNSPYEAKNIKITAKSQDEKALVPKSTNVVYFPSMKVDELKNLTFSFAATSESLSQNYVVGFTVEYQTGAKTDEDKDEVVTFTQYQGINIYNSKKEADKLKEEQDKEKERLKEDEKDVKKSVPKIMVKSYESDPKIVQAGSTFKLTMTYENTSATIPIKNIRGNLTAEKPPENNTTTVSQGTVFIPDSSSSDSFYIDFIEPKGTYTKEFILYAIPDASPKTYDVVVNFDYEDPDNNEIKSTQSVGIKVAQVTKLELSEIIVEPKEIPANQPVTISFQILNTGKVKLNNLRVKIEGDFDTSGADTFYGKLNDGASEYFDGLIVPTTSGIQNGTILVTYENEIGELKELRNEFEINVLDMDMSGGGMMGGGMGGEMPMDPNMKIDPETGMPIFPDESKKPNVILIIGVIVVVVIIIIIIIVVVKKRKKGVDFIE